MAYTLKLDYFNNDLRINSQGHFERISGADEVCQRVRIALRHQFSEYFLNRLGGVPYYSKDEDGVAILGSKNSEQLISNILRKKIMAVPGVMQVSNIIITKMGRNYYFSCKITVEKDSQTNTGSEYDITNIEIGA